MSWFLLFLVVVIEGTLTTVPLTLIFLLCLTVMKRQEWIFLLAFMAGLLLDIFSFRSLGLSSLFLVSFVFLLLLYQRKYETATLPFVLIAAFMGSVSYLIIIGQTSFWLQAFLSTLIAGVVFSVYRSAARPQASDGFQRV